MRTRKVAWRLPPKYFEWVRPHVTIRLRKKRMRKKLLEQPERYVNEKGHAVLACYWASEYMRRRRREKSFAALILGDVGNELFNTKE